LNGIAVTKPSLKVSESSSISPTVPDFPYVGRGGLKLEVALKKFKLKAQGLTVLDVGASTGGFTDCLLQNGTARVYSIDVGHDQLAEQLRTDPCVVSMEKGNARNLAHIGIPGDIDAAMVDVSFISLTLILPTLLSVLRPQADVVVLVKSQYEIGPIWLGTSCVVHCKEDQRWAVQRVPESAESLGYQIFGETPSPILGSKGNQEFLLWLKSPGGH